MMDVLFVNLFKIVNNLTNAVQGSPILSYGKVPSKFNFRLIKNEADFFTVVYYLHFPKKFIVNDNKYIILGEKQVYFQKNCCLEGRGSLSVSIVFNLNFNLNIHE